MDGWSRRHAGQSSWGFAMRTLISLVCLVLVGLGTAAVPASAVSPRDDLIRVPTWPALSVKAGLFAVRPEFPARAVARYRLCEALSRRAAQMPNGSGSQ